MIRLTATTQKLQAVLGGSVATNQLQVVACYSDHTSTAYSGGTQLTTTNNTTAVDVVDAPAASTIRDVDYISVRNRDTAAVTITIMLDNNGTDSEIYKITLPIDGLLEYTHGSGWKVIDDDDLGLPAVGDVQSGVTFGPASGLTGTFAAPTAAQVLNAVGFGAGGTEFTGTVVLPAVGDVQSGVTFGPSSGSTGTFAAPTAAQVLDGVGFGASGTEFTGTVVLPAVGDVQSGVTFGPSSGSTGTFTVPTEAQVQDGVMYGAGGTEFEGELESGQGLTVLLTGSGNFASPTSGTPMLVECWGKGGDGASDGGDGGGSGAYAASMVLSNGGAMAYDCDASGNCDFASTVIAEGASGSTGGLAANSTGDVKQNGADGGSGNGADGNGGGGAGVGNLSSAGTAGSGGSLGGTVLFPGVGGYFGSSGDGGDAGTPGTAGGNATGYGNGGGGGGGQSNGGTGAPGVIRITWQTATAPEGGSSCSAIFSVRAGLIWAVVAGAVASSAAYQCLARLGLR